MYEPRLKDGRRATHRANAQRTARQTLARVLVTSDACSSGLVTPRQRSAAMAQPKKSGHRPKNTMLPPRNWHKLSEEWESLGRTPPER